MTLKVLTDRVTFLEKKNDLIIQEIRNTFRLLFEEINQIRQLLQEKNINPTKLASEKPSNLSPAKLGSSSATEFKAKAHLNPPPLAPSNFMPGKNSEKENTSQVNHNQFLELRQQVVEDLHSLQDLMKTKHK